MANVKEKISANEVHSADSAMKLEPTGDVSVYFVYRFFTFWCCCIITMIGQECLQVKLPVHV